MVPVVLDPHIPPCAVLMMMREMINIGRDCIKTSIRRLDLRRIAIGSALRLMRSGARVMSSCQCLICRGLCMFHRFLRGTSAKGEGSDHQSG